MSGNNGGPWGGGGNNGSGGRGGGGGGDDDDRFGGNRGGNRPGGDGPQIPEIDELMNKGRERLRVLMGGDGGQGGNTGSGGGGPQINGGTIGIGIFALFVIWLFSSFYQVRPEERSVELFLGNCNEPCIGESGLNFAPWPLVTYEIVPVTREQVIEIGEESIPSSLTADRNVAAQLQGDTGLMLTGDENIVDIDFQVVWNITEPDKYLFNLADPAVTIAAVAESAMREIIAQSELANLNRDRESIGERLQSLTQTTLDSYNSGVNIVRINLDEADPPSTTVQVTDIDGDVRQTSPLAAYRDVQDAEQERVQLHNQADAYANRVTAQARGNAAQILEGAEGYRARVVNEAEGEASRFLSVLEEYQKAPEVTRQRLYLEMVEDVFGPSEIILLDGGASGGGGTGVVPYLPLDQLRRPTVGGSN